jgi:hypothetical protein
VLHGNVVPIGIVWFNFANLSIHTTISGRPQSMTSRHKGGCVCGAVRFEARGEPLRVTVCHCTWCQRRTGTAFSVEPVFDKDQVTISGPPLSRYRHTSDESGRWLELQFCPDCGTNIGFVTERRPGVRFIDAGTFDDPSWIDHHKQHFRHIYLRSARNWADVPAGVETHDTFPES